MSELPTILTVSEMEAELIRAIERDADVMWLAAHNRFGCLPPKFEAYAKVMANNSHNKYRYIFGYSFFDAQSLPVYLLWSTVIADTYSAADYSIDGKKYKVKSE